MLLEKILCFYQNVSDTYGLDIESHKYYQECFDSKFSICENKSYRDIKAECLDSLYRHFESKIESKSKCHISYF